MIAFLRFLGPNVSDKLVVSISTPERSIFPTAELVISKSVTVRFRKFMVGLVNCGVEVEAKSKGNLKFRC